MGCQWRMCEVATKGFFRVRRRRCDYGAIECERVGFRAEIRARVDGEEGGRLGLRICVRLSGVFFQVHHIGKWQLRQVGWRLRNAKEWVIIDNPH